MQNKGQKSMKKHVMFVCPAVIRVISLSNQNRIQENWASVHCDVTWFHSDVLCDKYKVKINIFSLNELFVTLSVKTQLKSFCGDLLFST